MRRLELLAVSLAALPLALVPTSGVRAFSPIDSSGNKTAGLPVQHLEVLHIDHSRPLTDSEKRKAFVAKGKRKTANSGHVATVDTLTLEHLGGTLAYVSASAPCMVGPNMLVLYPSSRPNSSDLSEISVYITAKAGQTYVLDIAVGPMGTPGVPTTFDISAQGAVSQTDTVPNTGYEGQTPEHIGFFVTASSTGTLRVEVACPQREWRFYSCEVSTQK